MPDVGDDATLTLTVAAYDTSTVATVAVVARPTGATLPTLSPFTLDGGHTWTAFLPLTAAGEWRVKWTVTGQGYGVEYDTVYAGDPDAPLESYATLSDLAAYLGDTPPEGAGRLLVRASRLIDLLLIGSVYDVDTAGLPTGATVITALRDATCAQVEWFDEQGDATGGAEQYQSMSIGSVQLTRGYTSGGSNTGPSRRYAPDTINILRVAGLLPVTVGVYG